MQFLKSLKLDGFLSFAPGSEAIPLTPLNVIIGPNGSGKSNLIEAVELLRNTPTPTFADTIRLGGGVREWIWKGKDVVNARIEADIVPWIASLEILHYRLDFRELNQQAVLTDEVIKTDNNVYYLLVEGPILTRRDGNGQHWDSSKLSFNESVLSQLKDPFNYPELAMISEKFMGIQTFREWSFGRSAQLRRPQPADLPSNVLLPRSENLGLLLNQLDHLGVSAEFNRLLNRFLPRYQRYSTLIQGSTVQIYLHEEGLNAPISATRLSDGTLRFMAMLALLLSPTPPSLLCIEEPELGLHPDAVTLLAEVIAEASTRTQIIVTTHSDALVSAFTEQTDSVLVCEHHGGSVLHRLESAKLQHWLKEYRLGEIWLMGELGGNP
jgi:predicted ATPase